MNTISNVSQFHKLFDHPILETPQIPDVKRCELRVELIREELKELQEAIDKKDIVEVADALCDLQYVISGAVLEFGLGNLFPQLFAEVHRSNMSKACVSEKEAKDTIFTHMIEHGSCSYTTKVIKNSNGEDEIAYLIHRDRDNKTMKSINYSPANIKSILNV